MSSLVRQKYLDDYVGLSGLCTSIHSLFPALCTEVVTTRDAHLPVWGDVHITDTTLQGRRERTNHYKHIKSSRLPSPVAGRVKTVENQCSLH